MATEEESLELLLNRATNPTNEECDWEAIRKFSTKVNFELDGATNAVRLLAHKIQSPQEREAIHGLTVLEHCATACDHKFHNEIGKFRFLNEMIKLVSPKYLGGRTSPKVKQKVIELLYRWTDDLKHESKVAEAYHMLKRQGVVTEDPASLDEILKASPPPPRRKSSLFEDEEKSKLLQRLLQSKNPEDLQAANRLIKTMVKEDEKRTEKVAQRITELEAVHNNTSVLRDMLANYNSRSATSEDIELIKELYLSCERLRQNLIRLSTDPEEKDEGLGEILKANDELTTVMGHYRRLFTDHTINGSLSLLDLGSPGGDNPASQNKRMGATDTSFLDDQLLALGLDDNMATPKHSRTSSNASSKHDELQELGEIFSNSLSFQSAQITNSARTKLPLSGLGDLGLLGSSSSTSLLTAQPLQPVVTGITLNSKQVSEPEVAPTVMLKGGLYDLDALGQILLQQSLPPTIQPGAEFPKIPDKIPMNLMQKKQDGMPGSPSLLRSENSSTMNSPSRSPAHEVMSLADIFVPLESIQPGSLPPLTLHEKNGLNVVLHFGKNVPRADVSVMVVSTMSKNPEPLKNIVFQAAVTKSMKIRLQPPSATSLPSYNPILPPAAITQVMLLANPAKEKIRLKYKISYMENDDAHTEIGEVDSLPMES